MPESLLDSDENVGFCTLLETTKSSLFTRGCSIMSEPPPNDSFWFDVCVPNTGSTMSLNLLELINDTDSKVPTELRDGTPILVQVQRNEEILNWPPERQAKFANALINRFLRAYEHTYFDLLVPRHRLDGRAVVLVTADTHSVLKYAPILLDLDEVLIHYLPPHMDVERVYLSMLMGSPEIISPSWRILIDGVRHFENGNLREAVLCACSAAEIVASPAVDRWFEGMTLNGGGDGLRNVVREMGNPLRFDLCISTVCKDAFANLGQQEKLSLLTQLRNMNGLRNRVVHVGEEPDSSTAAAALQAAAMFVCKVWLATLESGDSSA